MPKRNKKTSFLKKDSFLIFAALFGMVGSVIVFSSYANKVPKTDEVGRFYIADLGLQLVKGDGATYRIINGEKATLLKAGSEVTGKVPVNIDNKYCINGWHNGLVDASFSIDGANSEKILKGPGYRGTSNALLCVDPVQTKIDSIVKISVNQDTWITELDVSKQ